jgi:epoxyqueuosine reductase
MTDMVYGCDICQEVCPWNRGVEKRRHGARRDPDAQPTVSLVDWLDRDGEQLVEEYDRLYVPRNDSRWLRRNALIAAGNVGSSTLRSSVARHEKSGDPILADAARWAIARMAERGI